MTEGWVERKIGEAVERGVFDDLPGTGRPIPGLGKGYDPAWWAKGLVTRERALDAGIALTAEIDRSLPALLASDDRETLRDRVERWNVELGRINAAVETADLFTLLDRDAIEQRWESLRR